MNPAANRHHSELGPLRRRFWISLALFLGAALLCSSQLRVRFTLEKSRAELLKAQAGLAQLRLASAQRQAALEALRSQYGSGEAGASVEQLLYGRIDALRERFRPDELTISGIEKRGDEVSLKYSFRFVNPSFDDFLNALCHLEGSGFPLTMVDSVSVHHALADGKDLLSCTVNGVVLGFQGRLP